MIQLFADYHTHTVFSHGKGTIEENVVSGIKKGLKRIAITDHGFRHIGYGVNKKDISVMRNIIDNLNIKYQHDIEVLLGIEANLISMDGEIDIPKDYMDLFDLILVGFHKAAIPYTIKDGWNLYIRNAAASVLPFLRETSVEINTNALIAAINRYKIDIITHPGAKIDIDTEKLARAAAKRGTALEINSHHGNLTAEYVKIAMKEPVMFVISSDAHRPQDVGNFEMGIRIAEQAGVGSDRIINAIGCTNNTIHLKKNN